MGETTGIEWTDKTWNPWHGCHKVSPGCKFCYMFRDKERYGQDPNSVVRSKTNFTAPLKWKDPCFCFTCSWSDWLIEEADPWRDEAYDVIRRTPWITYQILTKRIERAVGRVPDPPLPNIIWGVSVESNAYRERIPALLEIPAGSYFVSYEPALGPLELDYEWLRGVPLSDGRRISQVIAGGESGPSARPPHPDWFRDVRDKCQKTRVSFFFKQWGEWAPVGFTNYISPNIYTHAGGQRMEKVGKKNAGALLDGREWKEFPQGVNS